MDGALMGSVPRAANDGTIGATVLLGGTPSAAGQYPFTGSIDEVRVFDGAGPEEAWRTLDRRSQADQLLTYGAEEAL